MGSGIPFTLLVGILKLLTNPLSRFFFCISLICPTCLFSIFSVPAQKMDDPTLFLVWLFTWIAMAVMATRLLLVKLYKERRFDTGDYLTMGAMFCTLARLALIHVVLVWGTNNIAPAFRQSHHFTPEEIRHREVGSRLTLVNRVFYNS